MPCNWLSMAPREAVRLATFSVSESGLERLDVSIMAYATFSRRDESNMIPYPMRRRRSVVNRSPTIALPVFGATVAENLRVRQK